MKCGRFAVGLFGSRGSKRFRRPCLLSAVFFSQQFLSKVQGRAPPSASEPPRSMSDPYTYTYAQETMEVVAVSLLIIAGLTTAQRGVDPPGI